MPETKQDFLKRMKRKIRAGGPGFCDVTKRNTIIVCLDIRDYDRLLSYVDEL